MQTTPANASRLRDPLAAALMPVLLHRINNATQVLTSLNALLAIDSDSAVLEQRAGDLAYASTAIDDLGWVLALLASACGADVLLERRQRRGLAPLFVAVREALRREGADLALEAELPDLEPDVADGWQLPWAFATWLWTAGRARRATLAWRLRRAGERWELVCDTGADAELASASARIAARLPAGAFELTASKATWSVPAAWLSGAGTVR